MAQSIKLEDDTYLDATAVMIRSLSSGYRKTLESMLAGVVAIKALDFESGTTVTFSVESGTKAFLFTVGANQALCGAYAITASSGGNVLAAPYAAASGLTIAQGINTLSIRNTTNNYATSICIVRTGDISIS